MPPDVLSEVLTTLELSTRLWFRAELSSPFSVAVPPEAGRVRFHVAAEGPCTISVGDLAPLEFGPGDLVMVPHGLPHVLSDSPDRPPSTLSSVIEASRFDGVGPLVHGGGGARTVVVCGQFSFGTGVLHPFLESLPPLMHVRADDATRYDWIEQVLRHIERESRIRPTGHLEVVRRLSEILLIEVLRGHAGESGIDALSALVDPQLGRVLEAVHAEPEADWSLDALARIAGLSRTLFVERFRERMGVPPMRYLTQWRLQKARSLLSRAGSSVAEVSREVGYSSDSAFNRAFRGQFGATPGAFLRARGGTRVASSASECGRWGKNPGLSRGARS
jgi:AraC-like DNA-binding protein